MGKCKFKSDWLNKSDETGRKISTWGKQSLEGDELMFCCVCNKHFNVMKGMQSVNQHAKTSIHSQNIRIKLDVHQLKLTKSIWEPPSEGYLSIVEQKEAANELTKKQMKNVQKHQQMQGRLKLEEDMKQEEEERARAAREKLKERRVEDLPPVIPAPIIPSGKSTPYGQWQTVKTDIPVVDLQLPQQALEFEVPVIPEPEPEPAPREFKEKVVESLGSGNTEFKKRRIGAVARRNTRQRLDDE